MEALRGAAPLAEGVGEGAVMQFPCIYINIGVRRYARVHVEKVSCFSSLVHTLCYIVHTRFCTTKLKYSCEIHKLSLRKFNFFLIFLPM